MNILFFVNKFAIRALYLGLLAASTTSIYAADNANIRTKPLGETPSISLDVYKSETCGCCTGWIEHMSDNAFISAIH